MSNDQYSGGAAKPPVVINDVPLTPLDLNGERVLTLAMIDRVHGRPDGTARKRFNDNRDRLSEGTHYSKMSASVFRTRFPGEMSVRATEDVTLLTERGYLMLVKSMTDDLAWQVQDALVESYFKVKEQAMERTPRIDVARESRMQMAFNLRLAKMIGLTGNQAVLAANRATVALTGVSALAVMGATHLPAPSNDVLLTPTEIGRRTGIGSARAVNARLCLMGLQQQFRDAKGGIYYEVTEAGVKAGGVMQDTGKSHSSGTPVRQLKWSSSILSMLGGEQSVA